MPKNRQKVIFFISGWIVVQIVSLILAFKFFNNNITIAIFPSVIFVILGIPFFIKNSR